MPQSFNFSCSFSIKCVAARPPCSREMSSTHSVHARGQGREVGLEFSLHSALERPCLRLGEEVLECNVDRLVHLRRQRRVERLVRRRTLTLVMVGEHRNGRWHRNDIAIFTALPASPCCRSTLCRPLVAVAAVAIMAILAAIAILGAVAMRTSHILHAAVNLVLDRSPFMCRDLWLALVFHLVLHRRVNFIEEYVFFGAIKGPTILLLKPFEGSLDLFPERVFSSFRSAHGMMELCVSVSTVRSAEDRERFSCVKCVQLYERV